MGELSEFGELPGPVYTKIVERIKTGGPLIRAFSGPDPMAPDKRMFGKKRLMDKITVDQNEGEKNA